jgi:hypothetical protein
MPIYIIVNGVCDPDRSVFFVEAPEDFGEWFISVLLKWLKGADDWSVVGICNEIKWSAGKTSVPFQLFLKSQIDYLPDSLYKMSRLGPRPKYHREKE